MRTWTLGPTVATLLLGVGVGAQAHAEEAIAGKDKGGRNKPDAGRARATDTVLSSNRRGGVYELASQTENQVPAAAAAAPAPAPSPQADARYNTAGLSNGDDLARNDPDDVAQRRGAFFARSMRVPVSTAYAAPLTATQETCMGSRTFGVQAAGFGVSVATTWEDRQCRRLHNARALFRLGYRAAAVQLLCMDEEVYAAMERAGTPCPGVRVSRVEISAPHVEPPPVITIDDVLFDFDRWTLRPDASRILDPLLQMMRADPTMRINIEGHTDWVGHAAYNQALSERRAHAVVEWLVAHGISRDRLTSEGRGEADPVANNQTREGRQLNRRVEIRRQ